MSENQNTANASKARRPYWKAKKQVKDETEVTPVPSTAEPSKTSKPKQVYSKKPNPEVFKPRAESSTDTHMKNDPLLHNSILIEGLTVVAPSPKQTFHLDFSQYLTIVRDMYLYLTRDKQFKTRVSLSMFEYYCIILLWRRIIYVRSEEERTRSAAENFDAALPAEMAIPEEVGRYLDGIGNFTDQNGRDSVFRLLHDLDAARIVGISGHFGPIDRDTHVSYETVPAPFVSLYRIAYDYAFTKSRTQPAPPPTADEDGVDVGDDDQGLADELPENWDLPANLKPRGAFVPNRNLLGWYRAETLSREMLSVIGEIVTLNDAGQVHDIRARSSSQVPIAYDILKLISVLLKTTKSPSDINRYLSVQSFLGSGAQAAYVTRSPSDYGRNESGMNLTPLAERMMQTEMVFILPPLLVSAATIFRYRMQRHVENSSDCLCYTTVRGGSPPGWQDTANDAWNQARWNHQDFNGPLTTGSYVSERYIDTIRKVNRLDSASHGRR